MSTARVIVTRPARDAVQWVRQFQQAGFDAEAFPLIDIAPLSGAADVQALQAAWQALPGYAACMFVSGHAVDSFFRSDQALALDSSAQSAIDNVAFSTPRPIPAGVRFMAPGPGTVAAMLSAGVPAGQIDAPPADASQFDSEALWQVIGQRDWQGRKVLVVRGQTAGGPGHSSGRDWLARQWHAAGATVDFLGVYQRRVPELNAAQLRLARQASGDGSVWLFSSSEAVTNLVRHEALKDLDWCGALALATHPRIAEAVRAAGWGVVVESRPALNDIRQALGSIESQHP